MLRFQGVVVSGLALCAAFFGPSAKADDLPEMIDGVIARATAIISGRFKYHVTCGVPNGSAPTVDENNEFVLSGASWRIDYHFKDIAGNLSRINHRGKLLETQRNSQKDGSLYSAAEVRMPQELSERTPTPPFFAGTLWSKHSVKYIIDHRGDGRRVSDVDLDGVPVTVIQWEVSQDERYNAFEEINNRLDNGGRLRLYVAPGYGHALPRIEHVAPDGTVAARFDASKFVDVGHGVFYPMRCRFEHFPDGGANGYFRDYEIASAESINDRIPEEAFVVELPTGTIVTDNRDPTGPTFVVGDVGGAVADLSDVISLPGTIHTAGGSRSLRTAVLLGLAAGLIVLVGVAAYKRMASSRTH